MALEDAVTLAACLRRAGSVAGVPAALEEFAARRRARTAGMLAAARINLGMFNEPDPVQARARDGRLQGLLQMDPVGETIGGWLYGHDAIAAAEEPLQAETEQAPARRRAQARRAHERWSAAVTLEDRSRLWIGEREGYARFLAANFPAPADAHVEEAEEDGLRMLRVGPGGAEGPVVLHLHGGGYTMGSARGAVALAARLAGAVGGWALVPDYRLAPEHAFPAALDDALAAYRWLSRMHPSTPVLLSGECAGGGLAIALAVRLRDAGEPLPAALHVVSPFCDLTVSSESANAVPARDPWLHRDRLRILAASYIHTQDPAAPLISPVRADLRGLPPLLVHAADDEALRDDAQALVSAARQAGVEARLELVPDSVHSFVLFDFLPETGEALGALSELASRALAPRS